MERGKFIVFEGIDGSGKSTQAKFLHEYLLENGYKAILTTEPTKTEIGRFIRSNIAELKLGTYTIQLAFTADRAEHVEKEILPTLEKGISVVSDRYKHSTPAYGVLTGLPEDKINALYAANAPFPDSDITLLLDIDPRNAFLAQREKLESFERKDHSDKDRMRNAYLRQCEADKNCVKIDGYQRIEAVHDIVVKEVLKVLR